MNKTSSPIKWHGGKSYLAKKIIDLFPPRCKNSNDPDPNDDGWLHFIEPYFGGGQVLFANDPNGISEVANDINGQLMNFWRVLQNDITFGIFQREIEATSFSKVEFDDAELLDVEAESVGAAINFFIRCRQSLSARMKSFAGITRNRTRRGMNEQVSAWLSSIEGLPEVHTRLKRVLILNDPALDVIQKEDGARSLFYCDPPYTHLERVTTKDYEFEMTDKDHMELLSVLLNVKGKVLLSGYRSKMYDDVLINWNRHDFKIDNKSSSAKTKEIKTECVWCNF